MKLMTPVHIPDANTKIAPNHKVLTLGSCFSDNIGNRIYRSRLDCLSNPFGTVFNPVSLGHLIERAIDKEYISIQELKQKEDRYFHYDFHSSFDRTNPESICNAINSTIDAVHQFINSIDWLILTFGTCISYFLSENNRLVSNCHKQPNTLFTRRFLEIQEMAKALNQSISKIKAINPQVKILFTVSPVRHTKEGLTDNALSKGRLLELCRQRIAYNIDEYYFPSYEIMIDELRDYRFYARDMIHPSELAIEYIWENFSNTYFSPKTMEQSQDFEKLQKALDHRPFDKNALGHQKFIRAQIDKVHQLQLKYPDIDLSDALSRFKKDQY